MFTLDEILEATGGRLARRGGSGGDFRGVSIDSRTLLPGQVFVAIRGENFDGHDFIAAAAAKGASCVIAESRRRLPCGVARGGGAALVVVEDAIAALSALARFHRERSAMPVIAVTGSNGKTTTKDLCARALEGSFIVAKTEGTKNNHIGVPMTLLGLAPRQTAAVLELGTNHFGEIAALARIARPNIAVITSVGPSHLEYFKTLAGVFREKRSLLDHLAAPAAAIVNADDLFLARMLIAKKHKPFIISIGIRAASDFRARDIKVAGGGLRFTLNGRVFRLNTPGRHNVYNALAAIAVGRILGVGSREMARRLRDFEFPSGRLTVIKLKGITFIDDSYNSSPASLRGALEVLREFKAAGRKILVMGDMLELGHRGGLFHSLAGREASRFCSSLVAVGSLAKSSAQAFRSAGKEAYACDSAEEAKDIVFHRLSLTPDDVVLIKGSRRMKLERIVRP